MTAAAVIDIGSARIKLLAIRDDVGGHQYQKYSLDTGLIEHVKRGEIEKSGQILRAAIEEVRCILDREGVTRWVILGTDALRDQNAGGLVKLVQGTLGTVNVLDEELEAQLFYQACRQKLGLHVPLAVDVGGGSVQVVWSREPGMSISKRVGTYALEGLLQRDRERSIPYLGEEWMQMDELVSSELQGIPTGIESCEEFDLVVGSSIMEDFFSSALDHSASVWDGSRSWFTYEEAASLAEEIGGRPYAELSSYFPANPGFMYGADKLLVVLLAVMRLASLEKCQPTNASSSTGLASSLLKSAEEAESLGLKVCSGC